MEAISWSEVQYKQTALPQLRITEETYRRDSITSSKTADSGYHSDPDISLSPLDFLHPDKCWVDSDAFALPHHVPSTASNPPRIRRPQRSLLLNTHENNLTTTPIIQDRVTSNPSYCPGVQPETKTDWTTSSDFRLQTQGENLSSHPLFDDPLPICERFKERVSSIASLSSTGSGGNYSITDDSEFEEPPDDNRNMFSKAVLTTITLIMRKIEINLNYAAYVQCARSQSSKSHASGEPPSGRRGSTQGSAAKRKSRIDESSPLEDQNDDGPNKRRRVSITTTEESENGPRFACPFYKHDPNRYRNRRTCPGPGWPTVHRMKEHLYRSHAQPVVCPRCYTMFDADSDLSNHLRSDPCQMSSPQPIDGIDRETLKNLRKRSPALRLEEDKWRDTYHMLFPDVSETEIPSPYYDGDSPTEESRRFRRELLQRIQRELFVTAEQGDGAVEQNLLRQVAGIIQRCENELLETFFSTAPSSNDVPWTQTQPSQRLPPTPEGVAVPISAPGPTTSFLLAQTDRSRPGSMSAIPTSANPFDHAGQQYLPDGSSQYPAMPWDSSEWIDWNIVFPPGNELQGPTGRGEAHNLISARVYT